MPSPICISGNKPCRAKACRTDLPRHRLWGGPGVGSPPCPARQTHQRLDAAEQVPQSKSPPTGGLCSMCDGHATTAGPSQPDHIWSIITCKSGCSPRRIRPCPFVERKNPPISPYYMWDVLGCNGTVALARGSRLHHFVRSSATLSPPRLCQSPIAEHGGGWVWLNTRLNVRGCHVSTLC